MVAIAICMCSGRCTRWLEKCAARIVKGVISKGSAIVFAACCSISIKKLEAGFHRNETTSFPHEVYNALAVM